MQITASDPSLSGFEFTQGNAAALETQQASDAILKVNGLTVNRQSNTIDDVIEGFNFTVNKAAVGETVNFSVDVDKGTAEQAVRDFVEAYNTFMTTANNLTGYSRDEKQPGGAWRSVRRWYGQDLGQPLASAGGIRGDGRGVRLHGVD